MDFSLKLPSSYREWREYFLFRYKVLRKPIGLSRNTTRDNLEKTSFHVMAINKKNEIIGVGRLHFVSSNKSQIRYMAVDKDHRGMGLGSAIVKKLEAEAKILGATYVMLNARENAINFYKSHGYDEIAPYNSNIDVPHTRMEKRLI